MHEYNTLRNELRQKDMSMVQATSPFAAAIIGLIGFIALYPASPVGRILIGITPAVYFGGMYFFVVQMIPVIVERIRQIEADVNRRAGEELLVWETHRGWGTMFDQRLAGKAAMTHARVNGK